MLNVLLHSPQHKRLQDSVEPLNLNLVQLLLILTVSLDVL